ncbi:MAG: GNAT family N-acetyltransferase [Pseudomonadota bacterium]
MAACVEELTLKAEDLQRDSVVVAVDSGRLVGLAQVSNDRDGCFLEKLFVNPADMGKGIGRTLFDWSCSAARDKNATQMIVEADPDAVLFYRAMGCRHEGSARSGSIPGRTLPRFVRDLTE